jgi:hypothetical protein
MLELGPYSLKLPDFITDVRSRDAPPLHKANATVNQVSLDFTIVLGRGTAVEADRLIMTFVDGLSATVLVDETMSEQGQVFRHCRYDAVIGSRPISTDHYIALPFGDLFHVAMTYDRDADVDAIRRLLLAIAIGAIVRHTQ